MRRFYLIVICTTLLFCFSSCGTKGVSQAEKSSASQHFLFLDSSDFAPAYKELDNFDELYVALSDYYTLVENAYINSDKNSLLTFSLPESELSQYKDRIDKLTQLPNDILSSSDTALSNALSKLELNEYVLRVNLKLAERDLLIAGGNEKNEQWFSELRNTLDAAYSTCRVGNE